MPRKRKLTDLGNRCRICLASDACTSQLFVDCLRPKIQNLEKCSSIEILDKPNYPKKICYICLYKLEMWSEFKLQFLKTNQTLVNHFKIVDPPTTEGQVEDVEKAIDDLFARIDGKRPRVVVEELKSSSFTLESNTDVTMKSPAVSPTKAAVSKTVDPSVEAVIINETEKKVITVNKSHTSDSSSSPVRKISRVKKGEREALTKRWEERKNALLAATGEFPSESDSDTGTQLSPVQKARQKLNSSSDKDEQKSKKIQRALKNLETNMTEKYTVSVENAIAEDERKTRSRRGNAEIQAKEITPTKPPKSSTAEQPKTDVVLKEPIIVEKKLASREQTKSDVVLKEPIVVEKKLETKAVLSPTKESVEKAKEQQPVAETATVIAEKPTETPAVDQPEQSREEEDIEIIDVDDDTSNVNPAPAPEPQDPAFAPQLVTSEVRLGNVTYIVKTTLGLPNTPTTKSDISLKTNGISIDQEGGKIDLLNLQKMATENDSATKEANGLVPGTEKCLNIEIEGMEAEALQRVQLELAKFVNEDIQKRLLDESTPTNETDVKKLNFKDTYESLEYQLKNIVEKVLRKNYETDKNKNLAPTDSKNIPPELLKDAEKSPVFQPEVNITKFNVGKLCKTYHINNLHILEEAKRQTGVVGPLSKTVGRKRTLKLPKRYDDFDTTLPAGLEIARTGTPTPKPAVAKPAIPTPQPIAQDDDDDDDDDADDPMDEDYSPAIDEPMPEEEPMMQDEPPLENNLSMPVIADPPTPVKQVEPEEKKKVVEKKSVVKKPVKQVEKKPVKQVEKEPVKQVQKEPANEAVTAANKTITSLQPVLTMIKNAQPHVEAILLVPTTPPANAHVKVMDTQMKTLPSLPSLPSLTNRPSSVNVNNKQSLKQILPSPTKSQPKTVTANSTPAKTIVKRQRHICGICGKELFSKEEAESHVKSHKTDSLAMGSKPSKPILPKVTGPKPTIVTTTTVSMPPPTPEPQPQAQAQAQPKPTKPKPKLMRCKRCQAIVEAKEVRSHVCNSVKFNCTLCECTFGAEHLLLEHVETHARNNKIVKKTEVKTTPKPPPAAANKSERVIIITGENEAIMADQEDDGDAVENQQQSSYSCFVCDKVFLEEDQMKEHLQMHCEEVGNDSDAEGHQCAFCGEKFQSEEILEAHVGNHLKDDGDEKINMMINMGTQRATPKAKKPVPQVFRCDQCTDTFSSSYQLAVHMRIHDDDNMVVEEEPEEDEHYVCNVCDEIFDSPDELAEHLNTEHNGNTHMCILCETSFSSVRELQEHVSTHL